MAAVTRRQAALAGLLGGTAAMLTAWAASVPASPIDRARIRPAWALSSMTASRR